MWLAAMKKSPSKKKPRKVEQGTHTAIATYIRLTYPSVIFTSDSSGLRLPQGLRNVVVAQRSKGKIPDMIILQPQDKYHGLILEIKSEESSPFSKKDGKLLMNKHVVEQAETLRRLRSVGYKAEFAVGFDGAKRIIDQYMYLK